MKAIAITMCVMMLAVALPCWAGGSKGYYGDAGTPTVNANVKMALHVQAHGASCKAMPSFPDTNAIVRTWNQYSDIDVFLLVFDYDSVLVVEYGLKWPGDWGLASSKFCGDPIVVGTIANSGDGTAMAWTVCQVSGGNRPAIWPVAWSWLAPISDGEIEIKDFQPNGPDSTGNNDVVDCRSPGLAQEWPVRVYNAGVNVDPYEGPPRYATVPSTWGAVKALFK